MLQYEGHTQKLAPPPTPSLSLIGQEFPSIVLQSFSKLSGFLCGKRSPVSMRASLSPTEAQDLPPGTDCPQQPVWEEGETCHSSESRSFGQLLCVEPTCQTLEINSAERCSCPQEQLTNWIMKILWLKFWSSSRTFQAHL